MKSSLPTHVIRPWGKQWQIWKRQKSSTDWTLSESGDIASLKVPRGVLSAVPARLVVATPFWIESVDEEASLEMARLEIEMKGLASGDRLESDVFLNFLHREDGRILVLGKVYPVDFPQAEKLSDASYQASPALAVLADNTVHLWRELDDLVATFIWKGRLVCWETMHWTNDTREIEVWLNCQLQQLKEELRINQPLRLKEWVGIFHEAPEGFLRDPILNEADRTQGPAITPEISASWQPLQAREAGKVRQQKQLFARALAGVAGFILLLAAIALFAIVRTQWKIRDTEAALVVAEKEAAPLREAAAKWAQMEAAVDQRFFPLEILRTVVDSMGPPGVRLTVFEMAPDKILVEGEAANVSASTEFFKALQERHEAAGISWEMPPPALQANSTARFIINGVRNDDASQ